MCGYQVFAGLGNGTVKQYDLRRPDPEECVSVLKCADHSGIHSLVSSSGKIYGSTRQAVIQWDENDQGEEISHVEGSIESLAYDAGTSCLVSSVRPLFENGQAKHDVWSLKENSCKKVGFPRIWGKTIHNILLPVHVVHSVPEFTHWGTPT